MLPTVFVVSVGISSERLRQKNIACSHPDSLLVAGSVDVAFFDKTGTLTKQGMELILISCNGEQKDEGMLDPLCRFGMAVCHTLTTTAKGELVGTQVDKAMFVAAGEVLQMKGDNPQIQIAGQRYHTLKQFEFDNERQTQSVIAADRNGATFVFVKGSPEAIRARCMPFTIPSSYQESVGKSAKLAVYQLAMAFKAFNSKVDLSSVSRDDIEANLFFGGFLNFRNSLRDEAPEVLRELAEANIPTAMITGDNVLTGVTIAREGGMMHPDRPVLVARKVSKKCVEWVDFDTGDVAASSQEAIFDMVDKGAHLAVTGEAWNTLQKCSSDYTSKIAKHIRVFGRCSPSDKVAVVTSFVESGSVTLMCGDGQNDCGSIKTAHVGVALSSAEASIVAPFTSLDKNITAVPEVLREGRCCTASALSAYSFLILYGQVEAYTIAISAYLAIYLSEWCWIMYDAVWSLSLTFSLPLAKAAARLTPRRPTASLLGKETVFSVCGVLVWNLLYLIIAMVALWNQDWFQCRKWGLQSVASFQAIGDSYESSVLFIMIGFQGIASAMSLNFGYSFRKGWLSNYVFVFFSCTWMLFQFIITLYPSNFSCIWRVNCSNEVREPET
jgi:magnesium-transporting ATPase (P-type)